MRAAIALAIAGASTLGCERPVETPRTTDRPLSVQRGVAAWYGGKFHGRKTASGERFDKNALTAAHRELPFGAVVRVVDASSGRSVVVRINDRGPFNKRRVIDLSEAAARELDMIDRGVAQVEIRVLSVPQP